MLRQPVRYNVLIFKGILFKVGVFTIYSITCNRSTCLLTVIEIHEDLEKAKKEVMKDRIPPRGPKDKPSVTETKDDTLQYDTDLILYRIYYYTVSQKNWARILCIITFANVDQF